MTTDSNNDESTTSQNNQHETSQTSTDTPNSTDLNSGPMLCLNNCGFFGSLAFGNYCSACVKIKVLNESKLDNEGINSLDQNFNHGESVNEEESMNSSNNVCTVVEPIPIRPLERMRMVFACRKRPYEEISFEGNSSDSNASEKVEDKNKEKTKQNCDFCRKKLKISMSFECKCGGSFCAKHRFSDSHSCIFDHRKAAKISLEKNNPVVKGQKIPRI
jgi:hypothetical protein